MKIKINEETYKRVMEKLLSEDEIPMMEDLTPNQDEGEDELEVMKRKLTSSEPIQRSNKPKFQTLSQFAGDGWIEKYLGEPTTDLKENNPE